MWNTFFVLVCVMPKLHVTTQVEAVKLFVLKTINLGTLVYQLFLIQTNANNAQKYLHVDNYADYLTVSLCSSSSCCAIDLHG